MDKGLHTTFLVEVEVGAHPRHGRARRAFEQMLDDGDRLALAPQVLAEFIHIVTDPRRFTAPLDIALAVERAALWWSAAEVLRVLPSDDATRLFLGWMSAHRLARKRILDTMLAATYAGAGIGTIVTSNARDFRMYGLDVVVP